MFKPLKLLHIVVDHKNRNFNEINALSFKSDRLLERFPFLWNRKRALDSCICRIFYGEPLHTSPENALTIGFSRLTEAGGV